MSFTLHEHVKAAMMAGANPADDTTPFQPGALPGDVMLRYDLVSVHKRDDGQIELTLGHRGHAIVTLGPFDMAPVSVVHIQTGPGLMPVSLK
jgi:hypothetical protein